MLWNSIENRITGLGERSQVRNHSAIIFDLLWKKAMAENNAGIDNGLWSLNAVGSLSKPAT
jgi:hypothetical protein